VRRIQGTSGIVPADIPPVKSPVTAAA